MKDKLLSILRDSRFYLILGGVILLASVFAISTTFDEFRSLGFKYYYDACMEPNSERISELIEEAKEEDATDTDTKDIPSGIRTDIDLPFRSAALSPSRERIEQIRSGCEFEATFIIEAGRAGSQANHKARNLVHRSIAVTTATLGALMFIYGLAMQRRRSE